MFWQPLDFFPNQYFAVNRGETSNAAQHMLLICEQSNTVSTKSNSKKRSLERSLLLFKNITWNQRMPYFYYKNKVLYGENTPLSEIAERFGTPSYVYSRSALNEHWNAFETAFHGIPHRICYAVKANSNLAILHFFAKKQAGFDIVSLGELERVLVAKGNPQKIVFSGVGKQSVEIARAIDVGIGCFNVESEAELYRIHAIAQEKEKVVDIALRINPNIDPKTHPYIATGLSSSKFGLGEEEASKVIKNLRTLPHLRLTGIACHIGSQLTELTPFFEAIDYLLGFIDSFQSEMLHLKHINIGGGLGVRYHDETPPSIADYVAGICNRLKQSGLEIIIEPGRSLVANSGILLTRVEYIKKTAHKNFAIVDAGMNDFARPSLYQAWHAVLPLYLRDEANAMHYDIVGPVCESGDFLANHRLLSLEEGDVMAVASVGAYGFCMSSNYNSRPRAAEVMLDQDQAYLIRERETIKDLFKGE